MTTTRTPAGDTSMPAAKRRLLDGLVFANTRFIATPRKRCGSNAQYSMDCCRRTKRRTFDQMARLDCAARPDAAIEMRLSYRPRYLGGLESLEIFEVLKALDVLNCSE